MRNIREATSKLSVKMWGATKQITFQKFNVLHELSALLAPHSHTQGPTGPESPSLGTTRGLPASTLRLFALGVPVTVRKGAHELRFVVKPQERAIIDVQSLAIALVRLFARYHHGYQSPAGSASESVGSASRER